MIQSYDQIKKQANLINQDVEDNVFIQKVYSSSHFICFTIRFVGQSKFLYIGRGSTYEGLWFSPIRVESFLRKRDKFLEYIRKHLSSCTFRGITMDTDDRIFSVDYHKWGRMNRFFCFYNARNLYFANHYYDDKDGGMKSFKSWTMKPEMLEKMDFDIFDEVGRTNLERKEGGGEIKDINSLLNLEKQMAMKGNLGGKSRKFYNRKKSRIIDDLENVKSVDALRSLAENDSDLSKQPMKIQVDRIKLKFKNPDHYKRRDEVYLKIKKLNKAKKILELRLIDTVDAIDNFNEIVHHNNLKTVSPVWRTTEKGLQVSKPTERAYRIYEFEHFQLGLGLSANGNDQLRTEWAKKSDMWFHLEGDKSAHIILKLNDLSITEDLLVIAGSALVEFSSVEYGEANLIYTQVKNLKGVKGASGKVIVKKEKHIRVLVDKNWRDITL